MDAFLTRILFLKCIVMVSAPDQLETLKKRLVKFCSIEKKERDQKLKQKRYENKLKTETKKSKKKKLN